MTPEPYSVWFRGHRLLFENILYLSLNIILANSKDPDKMSQIATFHLDLFCLQTYSFRVQELQFLWFDITINKGIHDAI